AAYGGRPVESRKNTEPKVPSGTTDSSPRFQPWVAGGKSPEPRRGERTNEAGPTVLSSLTGLDSYSRPNPAMNRWAILERPCGTSTHDTLNTCGRRRRSQSSNPIFGVGGSDCPTFRSARVSLVTSAATREGVFERAVSRRGRAGFRAAAFFPESRVECAIGRGQSSSPPGY